MNCVLCGDPVECEEDYLDAKCTNELIEGLHDKEAALEGHD